MMGSGDEMRGSGGDMMGSGGDVRGSGGDVSGSADDVMGSEGDMKGSGGEARGSGGDVRGIAWRQKRETTMDDLQKQVLAGIREDELVTMAMDLVSISSPPGAEAPAGDYLAGRLAELGMRVQLQEVEPGRNNVVGRLPGSKGSPTLLFSGHFDTSTTGREAEACWAAAIRPRSWAAACPRPPPPTGGSTVSAPAT